VVGLIGTHPEAEKDWYKDWNGRNPDGVRHDIGHDFVQAILDFSERANTEGAPKVSRGQSSFEVGGLTQLSLKL
jgi:hypothetical protein